MGRTNLIILCLGIFACIALSLMMKHAVHVTAKKNVHPAVAELYSVFREQLERPPQLAIEQRDGSKHAVLTIAPSRSVDPSSLPRVAKTLGRYLRHFRDAELRFDSLVVVVLATARTGAEQRFEIPVRRDGAFRSGWESKPKPGSPKSKMNSARPVPPKTKPAPVPPKTKPAPAPPQTKR